MSSGLIKQLMARFQKSRKPFEHAINLLETGIEEVSHIRYKGKVDVEYIENDLKSAIEALKKARKGR